MLNFFIVHIALIAALLSFGCKSHGSCFPNAGNFQFDTFTAGGIDEATFNQQLNIVGNHYEAEAESHGYKIRFNRLWTDNTANADTTIDEASKEWTINAYGGLARIPGMTADGYLAVTCHELGHHLGGAPHYSGDWATTEGGADYFATLRCMKELGLSSDRIAAASQVLANTLAKLGMEKLPSPQTPDKSVVSRTYEGHPKAQCRLDTYLAGLNCTASGPLSDADARINSCYDYPNGAGVRPRCWFKP